jgi:dihydrodipicolinate synthase/N-acetylneuraminate lyase
MEVNLTPIQGVYVATVTPRREDSQSVDLGASLDLIDWLCERDVNGIALLGSTGEFPHFSVEDRLHLIQFAAKRSTVPVFANVSHSTLDGAIALARDAVSGGAAALLLMPPFFFSYDQEQITEFYLRFAAALGGAVPILLYNAPAFSNEISFETASELLSTGLFAGIKDSSGEAEYFRRLQALQERTPFTFLVGDDNIFPELRTEGAAGTVSGAACAVPELVVALDRAINTGAAQLRDRLHTRLREFTTRIDVFPTPAGIKEAVSVRGLKTGPHAIPLGKQSERKLAEFREWFQHWLPAVLKEASFA